MILGSELQTDRLAIRPMRAADAPLLVALFDDPLVRRFVDDGSPLTAEQAALWVRRSNENHARFGYGTGVVVEKSTGALIGWAGFARPDGRPEEIIYGLAAASWGRGYGTEILKALIAFAEQVLKARTIRATVHPLNAVSARMLVRQGFRLEQRSYDGDANADLYVRVIDPAPDSRAS